MRRQSILSLAAALLLSSCLAKGTETGNAFSPNNAAYTVVLPSSVTSTACIAAQACNPAAGAPDCESQLTTIQGLPQLLGVPLPTGITTENDLTNALLNNQIYGGSKEQAQDCQNGIMAIPCDSPLEEGAFDSQTGSYAGILDEIQSVPACARVYAN